jgi:hypothetical protein
VRPGPHAGLGAQTTLSTVTFSDACEETKLGPGGWERTGDVFGMLYGPLEDFLHGQARFGLCHRLDAVRFGITNVAEPHHLSIRLGEIHRQIRRRHHSQP